MQRCTLEKLGGRRPVQCQVRQSQNAAHANNRKTDVDWLIHIGVDEFIVSQAYIGSTLYKLDEQTLCVRLRPIEQVGRGWSDFQGLYPKRPFPQCDNHRHLSRVWEIYKRWVSWPRCKQRVAT